MVGTAKFEHNGIVVAQNHGNGLLEKADLNIIRRATTTIRSVVLRHLTFGSVLIDVPIVKTSCQFSNPLLALAGDNGIEDNETLHNVL